MTTVFHVRPEGRFTEITLTSRERETHLGFNIFGRSFSNTVDVKAPIQFRIER